MKKQLEIVKALEKLYVKKEEIDSEITELIKQLTADSGQAGKTKTRTRMKKAVESVTVKKTRGRKPKSEMGII